jgi:hypothetical protein
MGWKIAESEFDSGKRANDFFLVPRAQTRSRDNSASYPICKGDYRTGLLV